jgi:hypothetical protein
VGSRVDARASFDGRFPDEHDGPRVTREWAQRELTRPDGHRSALRTLMKWERCCPFLDGRPLKTRLLPSPRQGSQLLITYSKADVEKIKAGLASKETRRRRVSGRTWVRADLAEKNLGVFKHTLRNWASKGCLHLGGRKLAREWFGDARGGGWWWYLEADLDAIGDSLGQAAGRVTDEQGASWLSAKEAHGGYGFCAASLHRWAKLGKCPHLPAGRLATKAGVSAVGQPMLLFSDADLQAIRDARAPHRLAAFDGRYPAPGGLRLNAIAAARLTGLTDVCIRNYAKRCPFLAEGRLRSEPRERPTRPGRFEATYLEADLLRLRNAQEEATKRGRMRTKAGWQGAAALLDAHGIADVGARVRAAAAMAGWGGAGLIDAERVLKESGGKPKWVWLCDPTSLARHLAGRSLAEAAAAWSREQAVASQEFEAPAEANDVEGAGEPRPAVVLGGQDDPVSVCGRNKPPLPPGKYRVVKALLDAYPAGLVKDELASASRYSDPHKLLRELCDSDKDWDSAIERPGRGYRGGYRVRPL